MTMAASVFMCGQALASNDTVKVINNASQVVITEKNGEVLINVKGTPGDKNYNYEYRTKKQGSVRKEITGDNDDGEGDEYNNPLKKCQTEDKQDSHFELFASDFYIGWGGAKVDQAFKDAMRGSHYEVGILNLLGVGYSFNRHRSHVSVGLGFNWSHYGLKKPYFWESDNYDVVTVYPGTDDFKDHSARLSLQSMQFPILFSQSLGNKWTLSAGAVLNWNYYAKFTNHYKVDRTEYTWTTEGLRQRKFSCDAVCMVAWKGLGAYFRYSPQSIFEKGWGPEMKNRWTLGLVLLAH